MLNDTPTPSNSGRAMMLAKFSGSGSSTAMSEVSSADSSSGASTNATSRGRRSVTKRIAVMAISAPMAADRKAPVMVALVAWMVTADPPASGAMRMTSATKARNPALVRAAGVGTTCTRTRPSGSNQSRVSSTGSPAKVTGSALNAVRRLFNCIGRKRVSATLAASNTGSGALARARKSSAIAASGWSLGNLGKAGSICANADCAAIRI